MPLFSSRFGVKEPTFVVSQLLFSGQDFATIALTLYIVCLPYLILVRHRLETGNNTFCNKLYFLSVIRHHDEHQRQEEGDQVHVQQAIPQTW